MRTRRPNAAGERHRRHTIPMAITIALVAATWACGHRKAPRAEIDTRPLDAAEARSDFGMVASGSEEATRAGVAILEAGGNAVDAAVATAFALGVSDPGASGLGGMTYVLVSMADGRAAAIDGSTPAPYSIDNRRLQAIRDEDGYFGYTPISVPTTLATLAHTLREYGTIGLPAALAPAIEIADTGFRLNPNSIAWATGYLDEILASSYLRHVVLEDGKRLGQAGDLYCRPDLKTTLQRISDHGAETFYRGAMAAEISADIERNGGFLRAIDLARYSVRELQPIRSRYRGAEILAFPAPGGGGEVIEALNILQSFPSDLLGRRSLTRLQLLIEAFRIAQADHAAFLGSPGPALFGPTYLDPAHAGERARMITPGRAIPTEDLGAADFGSILREHTTHLSVIDREGNVVSMTQTLCRQFGGKVATPGLGFPYNCCLQFLDFENPGNPYFLKPNGIYPTSMSPTIVRGDRGAMALGSAGSDRIPPSVTEVISNVVDGRMGLREAIVAPRVLWNIANEPPRYCLEIAGATTEKDADALTQMGFEHRYLLHYPPQPLSDSAFFGGVNAVAYDSIRGEFIGVADPRRSGFALGPRAVADPR